MVPIPGLLLFEEFVTEDEERQILAELDGGAHDRDGGITAHAPSSSTASAATPSWKPERHSGVHREQRYGMDHDLWSRSVRAPVRPMPSFVNRLLVPRFYSQIRMLRNLRFSPNEGNAIEYRRGRSWLESHVDDRAKHREVITNLSLAGDCCMTFTPLGRSTAPLSAARTPMPMPPPSASSFVTAGSSDGSRSIPLGHEVKVLLRRRTLLVMTGDARYRYAHGIQREDVLSDRRVSFTLRETV
jgi:alkylated DNA repair protein alkB family protein 4